MTNGHLFKSSTNLLNKDAKRVCSVKDRRKKAEKWE